VIDPSVFAARLLTPVDAEAWQDEWSRRVAEEMRANAPVRTGALRSSIRVTEDGVIAGAPYSAYVEYGTGRTAPQPYAGPAVSHLSQPAAADAGRRVIQHLT
jgi:HK97 gp10 family phage protein